MCLWLRQWNGRETLGRHWREMINSELHYWRASLVRCSHLPEEAALYCRLGSHCCFFFITRNFLITPRQRKQHPRGFRGRRVDALKHLRGLQLILRARYWFSCSFLDKNTSKLKTDRRGWWKRLNTQQQRRRPRLLRPDKTEQPEHNQRHCHRCIINKIPQLKLLFIDPFTCLVPLTKLN